MLIWGDFRTKVKVVILATCIWLLHCNQNLWEKTQWMLHGLALSVLLVHTLTHMHAHTWLHTTRHILLFDTLTLLDSHQHSSFSSGSTPKLSLLTFLPVALFSRDSFPFWEARKPILHFGRHCHVSGLQKSHVFFCKKNTKKQPKKKLNNNENFREKLKIN